MVLGLATSVAAVFFHKPLLAPWILLALLFWQLQETTRRALMCHLRFRSALGGDALSYLGQTACIAYLFVGHRLTLTSAFMAMTATSAAATLVQVAQLKLTLPDFRFASRLIPTFWDTGRCALLVSIVQASLGQALLWFLAFAGTAEVGRFQSALNLLRAANPVMFGIGGVLLPTVAARRDRPPEGLHAAQRYGFLGAILLFPYFAVIFIFPGLMLRLFYGADSVYAGLRWELRLLVIGSVFVYIAYILISYYYGLSKSHIVLRCQLVAVAFTVLAGPLLIKEAKVFGATVAYALTFFTQTLALVWFLRCSDSSSQSGSISPVGGEHFSNERQLVTK